MSRNELALQSLIDFADANMLERSPLAKTSAGKELFIYFNRDIGTVGKLAKFEFDERSNLTAVRFTDLQDFKQITSYRIGGTSEEK